MRGAAFIALAALTTASMAGSCSRCSHGHEGENVTITPDPVVDAAPREDASRPDVDRHLADARVVDLRKLSVSCALTSDLPLRETSDGRHAFLLGKDSVLRAFDLGCTGELWHATAPACDALVVAGNRVFCPTRTAITWWPAESTSARGNDVTKDAKPLLLGTPSPITQVLAIDQRLMVFHESTAIEVFETDTLSPFYSVKLPIRSWGRDAFVPTQKPKGACGATQSGKDYHLVCIDEGGAVRLSKTIVIAKPTDPPFSSFYVRANDGRYLLLSTMFSSGTRRAVVVRLSDGAEMARVEDEVAAVVTRVEDGTIEGLVSTVPKLRLLETSGATRWTTTAVPYVEDSAVALAKGNRIFVVNFPMISSGATPLAFDRVTGKLLWTGDFEALPIAHSIYSNTIDLSLRTTDDGEMLMLRGNEAMITYLQLFDLGNGKRRYSQTRLVY